LANHEKQVAKPAFVILFHRTWKKKKPKPKGKRINNWWISMTDFLETYYQYIALMLLKGINLTSGAINFVVVVFHVF
jgi:hypothetical protein